MANSATVSTLPTLGTLFTGDLVHLSAVTKDDRPTFRIWRADAEYLRQLGGDPAVPQPTDDYEKEPDDEKNAHHHDHNYTFAIRTLVENKLIGVGGLNTWASTHQNARVWIGIGDPDYRSKGYGTDAMRLLVGYAFRELNMHRVTLSLFSYNLRARRAYEKVGFVHEVTSRAAVYRDGQRYDELTMGLLRSDWEAQKNRR